MTRRSRLAVLAMAGSFLAACTGGSATGSLTGRAAPCLGPHLAAAQIAKIPVRVNVVEHAKNIATQTVRGSHSYRFNLAPGRYVVSSDASRGVSVVVHSGQFLRVNLGDDCK